ncbi:hypothetical protein BX600DRAFT_421339 [Xylariales sp. PMI_506]|nr:hypothetical protein BX600DRAFT_421339 [Xylariales sp. PMI_506]
MSLTSFKVIIVGGGPVGLTAAHALERAGIDFILLERRPSVVIDAGSNLVLLPLGMRILGQLGLLDHLNSVSSPLGGIDRLDHQGRNIGDVQWFLNFKNDFGAAPRVISRHDLTHVIHEALSSETKSKLIPNKKVANIASVEDGVVVTCTDGTSYEGSIVIGADGAHSMVRDHMRRLAMEAASPAVNAEKPFLTTYRCFWLRFPTPPCLTPGISSETHGPLATVQLFAGEETTVTGVYERLAEPTRDSPRYTEADQDALVARWAHLPLTEGGALTLGEAYRSKLSAGLVSLEEGVVDHWSWGGRVVLVGDAAHKFTPSTGAGCNNGIVDVVALANELHAAFIEAAAAASSSSSATAAVPTRDQVAAAFEAYQRERYGPVVEGCERAGQMTAMATWHTGTLWFLDRWVMGFHAVQRYFSDKGAAKVARTPVFNYFAGEERLAGAVPWEKSMVSPAPSVRAN